MKRFIVTAIMAISLMFAVQANAGIVDDWFKTGIDTSVGFGYVYPLKKFAAFGKMDVVELADGTVNLGLVVALPISEEDTSDGSDILGGVGLTVNLNEVVEKAGGSLLLPYGVEIGGSVLLDLQEFDEPDVYYGAFLIKSF